MSTIELDTLVEIAMATKGVYGARMTGGGFGGSTVTLVDTAAVSTLIDALETQYNEKYGVRCTCFSTRPGSGTRILWNKSNF